MSCLRLGTGFPPSRGIKIISAASRTKAEEPRARPEIGRFVSLEAQRGQNERTEGIKDKRRPAHAANGSRNGFATGIIAMIDAADER